MNDVSASLRATDDASVAVQKPGTDRISIDYMLAQVVSRETIRPETHPTMTIEVVKFANGFATVGKTAPIDESNYNAELGVQFAFDDAIRQAWPLFAFARLSALASGA